MEKFLTSLINIDSTSGSENSAADELINNFSPDGASLKIIPSPEGRKSLFYTWGEPKIIFCTHFDCVPPFIPASSANGKIFGRGACDAKGQVTVMAEVCRLLNLNGFSGYGLLLLAGEEDGSHGAKAANKVIKNSRFVIIGEPTENKLISASKGNILFEVIFKGKPAHSGYPHLGVDSVKMFHDFLSALYRLDFPNDDLLGDTTFNVSGLNSANASNVVPFHLSCKIFFRTTFASHHLIEPMLRSLLNDSVSCEILYSDFPMNFHTLPGFQTGVVAYGCDAPELTNLGTPLLFGPGSIHNAHTPGEFISIEDMKSAVSTLTKIFHTLQNEIKNNELSQK